MEYYRLIKFAQLRMMMKMKKILFVSLIAALAVTSCKTKDGLTNATKKEDKEQVKPNIGKVIVDLQPDYTAEELAADFSEYEMEAISITSKTLNAWAFRYNTELIKQEELLALLAQNEYVIKANGISKSNATLSKKDNTLRKKTVLPTKK